jgi:hypothetical protein
MKPLLRFLPGTLAAGAALAQPPGHRADFVTTLGRDTVAAAEVSRGPSSRMGKGVELVINRQDGQWGTVYHPERDLGRFPMQVTRVPTPREQFTIDVTAQGTTGELRIHRDTFVWTVAIAGR